MTGYRRVLAEVSARPWAIMPAKAQELLDVLRLRAAGVTPTEAEIEAIKAARPQAAVRGGGVAILPIHGVMAQRMDLMTAMSGGVSTEGVGKRFRQFANDPDVSAIVLHVDSPGGSVYGVEELSGLIREARGAKPIVAVADSLMASAGYWVGSAADEIVVTPGGQVGSIGVLAVHQEVENLAEREGVRFTVFSIPEAKKEGNPYEHLSADARAAFDQTLSDYYEKFVGAVAKNRGVRPDAVRDGYGEGRVLTAERALAERMVDRVATLDEVLADFGVAPGSVPEAETRHVQVAAGFPFQFEPLAKSPHQAAADDRWREAISEMYATLGDRGVAEVRFVEAREEDEVEDGDAAGGDAAPAPVGVPVPTAPEAREEAVSEQDTAARGAANGDAESAEVTGTAGLSAEQMREIVELCELHGIPDRAGAFIAEGRDVESVKDAILEQVRKNLRPMTQSMVDVPEKEAKNYSLTRLILAAADNDRTKAPMEFELSEAIRAKAPKMGKDRDGVSIWVPYNLTNPGATRLTSTDTGKGPEGIFDVQGEFIDMLRNQLKVGLLGARTLTGLRGDVKFPKQSGAAVATWVEEDPSSDVAESALALVQVALEPETLQATTSYTRQLLAQESIDVEMLVREDMSFVHAQAIDKAAIAGAGSGNEPEGILETDGIGSVETGGGLINWGHVVDLETAVAAANANIGPQGYLADAHVRGALKKTAVLDNTAGVPVWGGGVDGGTVNGYRAEVSNNVPLQANDRHALIFGVWNQLYIGFWTAFELIVDPYSLKKRGAIEVTSFQMAGIAIRHAEAFAAIIDAAVVEGS